MRKSLRTGPLPTGERFFLASAPQTTKAPEGSRSPIFREPVSMTIDEANVIADTWVRDPNIWFRDLSAALHLCINASMPPAGRYIKRDWCNAQPPFAHRAEAIEIIETIGRGNFGGPPVAM